MALSVAQPRLLFNAILLTLLACSFDEDPLNPSALELRTASYL